MLEQMLAGKGAGDLSAHFSICLAEKHANCPCVTASVDDVQVTRNIK